MQKMRVLFFGIILALLYLPVVYAQSPPSADCNLMEVKADKRPEPINQPTEVTVGLRLIDVMEIEDTSQTITADFMITQEWTDQRLAGFEGCQFNLDEVWTPQIDIVNSGRVFTRHDKTIEVLGLGRLRQAQRYSGSLVFVYDAHRFPFDTQEIVISLLSEKFAQEDVNIIIDDFVAGSMLTR